MSKTCQYATNDDKVVIGLKHVSVKNVQTSLQKKNYINKKKLRNRKHVWENACVENNCSTKTKKS
jgi:hypothetical protein